MNVQVSDLCDNITLAREVSMLGNYESAEVHYEFAQQLLSKLIHTISEPTRKNNWLQVQKKVNEEYCIVKQLKNSLQMLRMNTGDVPIGVRRRDDPLEDALKFITDDFGAVHDPDIWPSPTPVDHRWVLDIQKRNSFSEYLFSIC
nr:unnamed protein product [Callosobruchus chinensis]